MRKRPQLECNCGTGAPISALHVESCPIGASQRARHRMAVRHEEKQHLRALQRFKSSIRASARKMVEDLVDKEIDELTQHALAGRGFRLTLMICEKNGMPWKAEPQEPQERLIISPNEQ